MDAAALGAALVERQIAIRGEVQHMRNTVEKAYEAVEALAKAVYSNVFDDLVRRINASVGGERGFMSDRSGERKRLIKPTARGGPTRMTSTGAAGQGNGQSIMAAGSAGVGGRPRMLKPKGEGGSFSKSSRSPSQTPPGSNTPSWSKICA